MLDLRNLLLDPAKVKKNLARRGFDFLVIDQIVKLAQNRREFIQKTQALEARRNSLSKQIGLLKSNGQSVEHLLKDVDAIKKELQSLQVELVKIEKNLEDQLLLIPNLVLDEVPDGKSELENVVIKEVATIGRQLVTNVKPHYEIGEELNLLDFERSVKISGSRFWSYKGLGAKLVRALTTFMLDNHVANGYTEINPPVIVRAQALQGTGQLPKFADGLFKVKEANKQSNQGNENDKYEQDGLYLIPTAEVPLTNFYYDEIIDLEKPVKLTGYSLCFRNEVSAGGKDAKGLIRGHQFHKVELVKIVKTQDLKLEYEKTLQDAAKILTLLELPHRFVALCAGDLGFSAERTIDLEVWIPSENRYREISSVSSFGDFQGRRAKIRYHENNQNKIACTINASALAIDRTMAAILENYQNSDGTISIPGVLMPYMGISKIKHGRE